MQCKKIYKWIFPGFLLLLLLTLPYSLVADDIDYTRNGKFLYYGIGARALSMGGAYTSLGGDILSMYYNPAGLSRIDRQYNGYTTRAYLYGLSNITFFGTTLNRPKLLKETGTLGIGFVSLSSGDFQKRDEFDNSLGVFNFSQTAMIISGAGERVIGKSWGILSFGASAKFIFQDFGYDYGVTTGTGFDAGLQLQMLNPPIIKKLIPLRWLIPLRVGLAWQNINNPKIRADETREMIPSVKRLGFSYHPYYKNGHNWTAALDLEWIGISNNKAHVNMGLEYNLPIPIVLKWPMTLDLDRPVISPRVGYMSQPDKLTLGIGLKYQFGKYDFRFDYSFKDETIISSEYRWSLTVNFGRLFGSEHFCKRADFNYEKIGESVDRQKHYTRKARNYYLQEVARYPRDTSCIRTALTRLADELDPADSLRYYQLIKGLRLARYLYRQTVDEWMRQDTFNQAVTKKDNVALVEYHRAYTGGERGYFGDLDLMDYALLLLIVDDSIRTPKILNEVSDTHNVRYNYLYGQYYLRKNDSNNAVDHFRQAVAQESSADTTLRLLSAINLAELLDSLGDNDGALNILDTIISRENFYLREDYPRFRTLKDTCWADNKRCPCLADDALYKRGLIYYKKAKALDRAEQPYEYKELIMEAIGSLNEVIKLYYKFEYFEKSKVKIDEIMKQYNQENK